MLFSASVPILMGVRSSPDSIFKGEDLLTISQTNTNTAIKEDLANKLNEQDFVEVASPEIYAFSYTINRKTKGYEPVAVRGVEPNSFLKIENAHISEGGIGPNFMLVGEELSSRLGIKVGDCVTITGSTAPAILELTVTGKFKSGTSSNNQMLVPLSHARKLMALKEGNVLIIRVKTDDREKLIDYLKDHKYSVIVSGKNGMPIPVNQNKTYEERIAEDLAIKYTNPTEFSASNQSFVSTFVQKGIGNIGMVVLGFITLNALLTFVGITAILAKAVIERKKDIGTLAAIGADKKTVYLLLLKDLLFISTIASGIGVAIGFVSAEIVQNLGLIVAFGHTIQPTIDLALFIITFFVAIIIGCTSGLMVSSIIMTESPSKLMREIEDFQEVEEAGSLDGLHDKRSLHQEWHCP